MSHACIVLPHQGFGKFGGNKLGVIVMFPTRGISSVQRQQMVSCAAHNVKVGPSLFIPCHCTSLICQGACVSVSFAIQVVGVEGDFDDCQRLVKSMFAEQEMKAFIG